MQRQKKRGNHRVSLYLVGVGQHLVLILCKNTNKTFINITFNIDISLLL